MANERLTSFSTSLKRYRLAAGLTQEQLAKQSQLSADAIAALETGKRRTPRAATVEMLADALALSGMERAAFKAVARPTSTHTPPRRSEDSSLASAMDSSLWRLAAQSTPLIGRMSELEVIRQRFVHDGARVVTLVGPAGVGKTRLALAAATELADVFPNRITLINLTSLRDPQFVLSAIGQAFDLVGTNDIAVMKSLRDALQGDSALLVLDNFDRVLPATAQVAELLASCPGVSLLVTSRIPLQLRWEHLHRVAPLPVPDLSVDLPPLDVFAQIPAVELFAARARTRRSDFRLTAEEAPLVAQLVVQLDGLPLALELAASRLDVLPLGTIVRRLEDRLRLLRWEALDLPERQRSLQAAISWSYEMLSEDEQRLLRHLGVFLGQVALDAIHAVEVNAFNAASADGSSGVARLPVGHTLSGLTSLAEKSLILPGREDDRDSADIASGRRMHEIDTADSEPAFGILETTREYAWEQLERHGELPAARHAHADFYLNLAERVDPLLRQTGQRAWFLRLDRERDNLRAALRWLLDQSGPDAQTARAQALRLATALGYFWRRRGYLTEGTHWLSEALGHPSMSNAEPDPGLRLWALIELGVILTELGTFDRGRVALNEALGLAQARQDAAAIAETITALGTIAMLDGDEVEGARLLDDALNRWRQLDDRLHAVGVTLYFLGMAAFSQGRYEEAAIRVTQAHTHLAAMGDERLTGAATLTLAVIYQRREAPAQAIEHARESLAVSVTFNDRWLLSICARVVLTLVGKRTDARRRARLLGAADALGQASSAPLGMWERLLEEPNTTSLRRSISHGEYAEAYRAGRSSSFDETVKLARLLLEEIARDSTTGPTRGAGRARQGQAAEASDSPYPQNDTMSPREQDVLRLVAQGLSSKVIGERLFLSTSTINQHVKSIFDKLGVDTRAQAVAVATQRGLL